MVFCRSRSAAALARSSLHSLASQNVVVRSARPFDSIPAPRMLPGVGSLFDYVLGKGHWFRKMHEVQADRCERLGRIYRENFAGRPAVFVADPDAVEKLFKAEMSSPRKPPMLAWIESRADLGLGAGLLSPDRDEWKRFRSPMTKNSLNSKKMRGAFTEGINDIATDFADFVATLRNADTHVVSDVFTEGVKFSLEVMGLFVYGKRLDCMEATVQPEYQDFLDSVRKILENYNALRLSYGLHKKFKTSTWRANQEGWNGSVKFNEKLVAECESRLRGQLPAAGGRPYYATCLMEQMFSDGLLSRREAVLNAMDMFVAGIYAVGSAFSGLLYHVASDSSLQDRLYNESVSVLGSGQNVKASADELQRMALHKNAIKEGLRLSSVYPVNFRVLDNDIDLLDYNIPANTPIGVCYYWMNESAEFYDQPQKFNPDRWSKESNFDFPHPFTNLPFGHGMRMCPARRLVELELQVALHQICRRFRLENATNEPIKKNLDAVLVPDRPMSIRFMDR
ncbi:25-hydroxyvitamin D-1 alpha hydroxylase, mitochondrial-like [Oscarella lobularis]|uniref:25-hydroxyvitamin D-1 alpha hydroxylase, mitochondrial-like n=1 Tax=Oscarella lobularis TaxID=121494 RepID=UPI0033137F7F